MNLAMGGDFEPRHDVEQCRFAAARRALNGHMLTQRKVKPKAFKKPFARLVRMSDRK